MLFTLLWRISLHVLLLKSAFWSFILDYRFLHNCLQVHNLVLACCGGGEEKRFQKKTKHVALKHWHSVCFPARYTGNQPHHQWLMEHWWRCLSSNSVSSSKHAVWISGDRRVTSKCKRQVANSFSGNREKIMQNDTAQTNSSGNKLQKMLTLKMPNVN